MSFIFLLNLVLAFIAVGLIWTIQLVHYPTMRFIPKERFVEYHNFHSMRISFLAIPLMVTELGTSLILFYQNYNNAIQTIFLINLVIVALIWLSTFLIQVPLHNALSKEKQSEKLSKLICTNWIRTILWTARSILMILFLAFAMDLI
tara:strand:- start:478 stop:918 length:441 start_codon:yes stop_codon:yes gene_type:complete